MNYTYLYAAKLYCFIECDSGDYIMLRHHYVFIHTIRHYYVFYLIFLKSCTFVGAKDVKQRKFY